MRLHGTPLLLVFGGETEKEELKINITYSVKSVAAET